MIGPWVEPHRVGAFLDSHMKHSDDDEHDFLIFQKLGRAFCAHGCWSPMQMIAFVRQVYEDGKGSAAFRAWYQVRIDRPGGAHRAQVPAPAPAPPPPTMPPLVMTNSQKVNARRAATRERDRLARQAVQEARDRFDALDELLADEDLRISERATVIVEATPLSPPPEPAPARQPGPPASLQLLRLTRECDPTQESILEALDVLVRARKITPAQAWDLSRRSPTDADVTLPVVAPRLRA